MLRAVEAMASPVALGLFLSADPAQVLAHELHAFVRHAPAVLWGFWSGRGLVVVAESLWGF